MGAREELEKVDFKEVLDHVQVCVSVIDGEGRTLYVNPTHVAETGVQPRQILGRPLGELVEAGIMHPDPVSLEALELGRTVVKSGSFYWGSVRYKGGLAIATPIRRPDGSVKQVVVTLMDAVRRFESYEAFLSSQRAQQPIRVVEPGTGHDHHIIGESEKMGKIHRTIQRVARTDATVLILGESGVGKELVADSIQRASLRSGGPYVKLNCAAIPPNLLEAELFGYEKGAFTGASAKGKPGLLELANGGTILLDEIGDFPLELQPKLLRALQQKEITRVGGGRTVKLDLRVIAATNSDLKRKLSEGRFREDLYYRLSVIPIHVPPLRERVEDIRRLAEHFFAQYCEKYRRTLTMPRAFMDCIERYRWPGNVRELQNIIEYFVLCTDDGGALNADELEEILGGGLGGSEEASSLEELVGRYEKHLIEESFRRTGSLRKTARALGCAPATLWRKAKKYGIQGIGQEEQ